MKNKKLLVADFLKDDTEIKPNNVKEIESKIKHFNSLPIKSEVKDELINNEIKILLSKQQITLEHVENLKNINNMKKTMIDDISFLFSLNFDSIYLNNVLRVYSVVYKILRFCQSKILKLDSFQNKIVINDTIHILYASKNFNYDGCKEMIKNLTSEMEEINNNEKNSVLYSTIHSLFDVITLITAHISDVLTSKELSYFYFGENHEEITEIIKNSEEAC